MSAPVAALEGARIRLRPPAEADLPTVAGWFSDPELVAPFDRYGWDRFDTLAEGIRRAPEDPTSLAPRYLIESRAGGAPLGCVGHYRAHPVLAILDVWYLVAAPTARGAGVGTEAVALLADHLFATTAFARIGATCDVENVASAKLVQRLGFHREGTLRSGLYHHGRWHDVAVFGVTRSDWQHRPATGRDRTPPAGASAPPVE